MWLGITEYLFRNPELLQECIDTAIDDNTFRADDLEFTFAARVSFICVTTVEAKALTRDLGLER